MPNTRMTVPNKQRDGKPFIIYGLVCPITLEIKYVGQTIDLGQRTKASSSHKLWAGDSMKQWLDSLGYLRPYRAILERGVNRVVRVPVVVKRKPGQGRGPSGYKDVWLSTCLETKWLKRFRKTVLNTRAMQLPTIYDALSNPPLPWDDPQQPLSVSGG